MDEQRLHLQQKLLQLSMLLQDCNLTLEHAQQLRTELLITLQMLEPFCRGVRLKTASG
ncbi:hypothetical protein OCL06_00265 [Alteromonas sp. ASW11-19]|uniref:Uncharacterized protein n=1 Tax=Alteromonas salexigens TaxID=2982530 RepID=A0ABT2VIQ7_9ALTE|nr:hypothetical protein [Alteromonas salexigens]MCU7553023.1 hypothetical protein [Alteromonas salexigens]